MDVRLSPYFVVAHSPRARIVRITRTAKPFETIEEMVAELTAVSTSLDRLGRAARRLLVDTRLAPPRNDAAFESAFEPLRQRMMSGFEKTAVLVATSVGKMQVERHTRSDRLATRAFSDPAEAESYCAMP